MGLNNLYSEYDNSFDAKLKTINNIHLHPEYKPFIGRNYKKIKVLFVGESHYIKYVNTVYNKRWYEKSTSELFKNCTDEKENIGLY